MLEDIIKERLKKRDQLTQNGINPYPSKVQRQSVIGNVLRRFFILSILRKNVVVVGRVTGFRNQGGVFFADIKDETGSIQAVAAKKRISNFNLLRDNLDIGDFVEAGGRLFTTKKGEKSIEVRHMTVITKSLRPLPSEWYGLKDVEERFRKRYIDLLLSAESKAKLLSRSQLVKIMRDILTQDGFIEVETPVLQAIPGGATARPFKTHHNALDVDFYLRIAPELYLKRLLIGGFEKIFEIGRNFRNEGIDRDHNPEFTMLELYWAYQDYEGLMKATRQWLLQLLSQLGITKLMHDNQEIGIQNEWRVITYADAIKEHSGKDIKTLHPEEIDDLFKKAVRPKLIQPTFVIRYPKSISPLAKACADDSYFTERFQLVIAGTELVNGFSELNDPTDQRSRMEEQERMHRAGNEEASRLDNDFLEALEYGMPPAAGLGIGIDRLAALITNTHSIKEVIAFPTLRPR